MPSHPQGVEFSEPQTPDLSPESDLEQRWLAQLAAGALEPSIDDIVGMIVLDGVPRPITADQATFRSVRRLGNCEETQETRIARVSSMQLGNVKDGYKFGTASQELEGTRVGNILLEGYAPLVSYNSEHDDHEELVLFQVSPPEALAVTRVGFLGQRAGDKAIPLFVTVEGDRYLVEVKGTGNAWGGFVPFGERVFETVMLGGLSMRDAKREFNNLSRASQADLTPILPLAVGRLLLTSEAVDVYGDLGIVLRLTPSNIRLSHHDTSGSVPLESAEDTMVVLDKLLDNLLYKFLQPAEAPVFISPASHLENYLVSDGFRITETDFEDFREFGSSDIPFVHAQTGSFIDTQAILQHYFINFSRLDHFDEATACPEVALRIQQKLAQSDIQVDLSECSSMIEVADELWRQWLIVLDYDARRRQAFAPDAMAEFFAKNYTRVNELAPLFEDSADRLEILRNLNNSVVNTEGLAKLTGLGAVYLNLHMTSQIKNGERYANLVNVYGSQSSHFKKLMQRTGISRDDENRLSEIMSESRKNYEISARIFGGLQFFTEYVESELDYVARLQATGKDDLEYLNLVLSRAKRVADYVNQSSDYELGTEFFWNQLADFMVEIHAASDVAFGD